MILQFILDPIFYLLNTIIGLFPILNLPIDLTLGIGQLLSLWSTINSYVPITFVLSLIGGYWFLVNGKLFIAIISWVYEKIPFI